MTLKDQFEDIIQATLDTSYPIKAIENNPVKCVSIAEEFTIKFAEWLADRDSAYAPLWNGKYCSNTKDNIEVSELLLIFKQEKGL